MLEDFYVKPKTLDRVRASWIADPIEKYIAWLEQHSFSASSVRHRVSILCHFGDYAANNGAKELSELPAHIEPFIEHWVMVRKWQSSGKKITLQNFKKDVRNPIQQMVKLIVPTFSGLERKSRIQPYRFEHLKGFFRYLEEERGLSINTIKLYHHCLRRLDKYLVEIGITDLNQITAPVISAFITRAGSSVGKGHLGCICAALKSLFRYLYRERIIDRDLTLAVEGPQRYRLSDVPRSIDWEDVRLMLEAVDRRSAVGKRDYAILLLLVTYGLRAREVAALTLDDIDWKQERLFIPGRKAGHSAAFPLTPAVGNAIMEYLKLVRPQVEDRHVFFRSMAPQAPITFAVVAGRAAHYLKLAGVLVAHPGSHTLRHTCVRRLLEANISLKVVGDYLGHRSAESTKIYSKIDIEKLRQVALGDGESVI